MVWSHKGQTIFQFFDLFSCFRPRVFVTLTSFVKIFMLINKKILCFLLVVFALSGCASAPGPKSASTHKPLPIIKISSKSESHALENIKGEKLAQYAQKKGVIFAKTNFEGILKTSYVKLIFQDVDNADNTFQLYVGDNQSDASLSDEEKSVMPGYFFIELPQGHYRIATISIPVGSTLATEEMNVTFDVIGNAIVYLGTLHVDGTKEKFRLGGVPLIKPGFEYSVQIIDEQMEAKEVFKQNYPNVTSDIESHLMQIPPSAEPAAAEESKP